MSTEFSRALEEKIRTRNPETPLSIYIHIPYCKVRCGYCDFNTYTAQELGEGVNQATYHEQVMEELSCYFELFPETQEFDTVFIGGGTPTLLPAEQLCSIVAFIKRRGLSKDAEITTEANPDTLSYDYLKTLKTSGFTRISIGMQSAVPEVLKTLDRTHNPENVSQAVKWCKELDLQVSLDLIYGTPGESTADWEKSLNTALELQPDHISAYALIIEEGTKMYRDIKKGVIPEPDPDDQAEKYEIADTLLNSQGYDWYEVSNWSRSPETRCAHNRNYWKNADWLGIGPGAHGHINGLRWMDAKHPRAYAERLRQGFPIQSFEVLTPEERNEERIMLAMRVRDGILIEEVPVDLVNTWHDRGYIETLNGKYLVLTQKGRLFADLLVKELLIA